MRTKIIEINPAEVLTISEMPQVEERKIIVNDIEITAYSDGSIGKSYRGQPSKRQFGTVFLGYRSIRIGGKTRLVHRLVAMAFLDDYSEDLQVDHINGVRHDNRLSNLRMVTHQENAMAFRRKTGGTSSRFRGVSWEKRKRKWKSQIKVNGRAQHLGYFENEKDAASAYNDRAIELGFTNAALNH